MKYLLFIIGLFGPMTITIITFLLLNKLYQRDPDEHLKRDNVSNRKEVKKDE